MARRNPLSEIDHLYSIIESIDDELEDYEEELREKILELELLQAEMKEIRLAIADLKQVRSKTETQIKRTQLQL